MDITASSGLIECLHCATSNDDLAKFCVRCGQRLLLVPPEPAKAPARAVCVRCGQVNRPGALLCAACGIPIQNYAALVPRVKRDDVGAGARTPQAATATVASTTASPPPVAKGSAASASVDSRAPRPPASMPAPAAAKSPIAPAPPSRAPAPSASPVCEDGVHTAGQPVRDARQRHAAARRAVDGRTCRVWRVCRCARRCRNLVVPVGQPTGAIGKRPCTRCRIGADRNAVGGPAGHCAAVEYGHRQCRAGCAAGAAHGRIGRRTERGTCREREHCTHSPERIAAPGQTIARTGSTGRGAVRGRPRSNPARHGRTRTPAARRHPQGRDRAAPARRAVTLG